MPLRPAPCRAAAVRAATAREALMTRARRSPKSGRATSTCASSAGSARWWTRSPVRAAPPRARCAARAARDRRSCCSEAPRGGEPATCKAAVCRTPATSHVRAAAQCAYACAAAPGTRARAQQLSTSDISSDSRKGARARPRLASLHRSRQRALRPLRAATPPHAGSRALRRPTRGRAPGAVRRRCARSGRTRPTHSAERRRGAAPARLGNDHPKRCSAATRPPAAA